MDNVFGTPLPPTELEVLRAKAEFFEEGFDCMKAENTRLRGELDWHRQTVHRAHHDQPMETCEKNTCQGARKALEAQHEKD